MPHTPHSGQLTKLAALNATVVSAQNTLTLAQANVAAATANVQASIAAVKQYERFIYGNGQRPNVIDEGADNI